MDDLGARLRDARNERGWTLEQLAERSGLSPGFLSQVERGLSTLSIVSLSSICRALDLPIETLFSSTGPLDQRAPLVTRADQQLNIKIGGSPIEYGYLTGQLPQAPIQELLIGEFPGGCRQDGSAHEGEEFGYVLEGELVLRVGETEYALSSGDSYHIAASQPHDYSTGETVGARVLMAITQRFIDVAARRD